MRGFKLPSPTFTSFPCLSSEHRFQLHLYLCHTGLLPSIHSGWSSGTLQFSKSLGLFVQASTIQLTLMLEVLPPASRFSVHPSLLPVFLLVCVVIPVLCPVSCPHMLWTKNQRLMELLKCRCGRKAEASMSLCRQRHLQPMHSAAFEGLSCLSCALDG